MVEANLHQAEIVPLPAEPDLEVSYWMVTQLKISPDLAFPHTPQVTNYFCFSRLPNKCIRNSYFFSAKLHFAQSFVV